MLKIFFFLLISIVRGSCGVYQRGLINISIIYKMADYLTILSALILVAAFFALGVFIFNLGVMERRAMMGEPPRSLFDIPEEAHVGVRNPFVLELQETDWKNGELIFLILDCVIVFCEY